MLNDCCSHRNMLWNVADPSPLDRERRRLHGLCQACHSPRSKTLVSTGEATVSDVRSEAVSVREDGGKPAGNCLPKTVELTRHLHGRGIPATVRTAPFGFDERLHYVTLFNGRYVSGMDDRLYAADPTLTQFEGEPTTTGASAEDIPEVVIVPKASDAAERWYASLEPPTLD